MITNMEWKKEDSSPSEAPGEWAHSNIHILPIHIPDGSDGEESSFSVGELGSIPG